MSVYYNDIDPYCCAVLKKNIERGNLPQGDVDGRDIRTIRASELVEYRHVHLFAGIGGFPLGIGHLLDGYHIVTGGFPCQPHSLAGKRKASADERDLWPETFRIIRQLRPDYAIGENVLGLLSSESGRFFGGILRDMASIGYDAQWTVLRASDFGAPHRRARVFLVAYPSSQRPSSIWHGLSTRENDTTGTSSRTDVAYHDGIGCNRSKYHWERGQIHQNEKWNNQTTSQIGEELQSQFGETHGHAKLADAHIQRCEECDVATSDGTVGLNTRNVETFRVFGETQSLMGGDAHGLSRRLDGHRWPVGPGQAQHDYEPSRVTMEPQPHRVARLKALGNAIVPQCVEYIAQCILAREAMLEEGAA